MENRLLAETDCLAEIDFGKLRRVYESVIRYSGCDVIPVVVQDADSMAVLIVAYANEKAVMYSLLNGVAAFWSTSRNELWIKGQSSGNVLELCEVLINCEENSILYLVRPSKGGACHMKDENGAYRQSCFYREIRTDGRCIAFVEKQRGGQR